jgi:hypothetical protein
MDPIMRFVLVAVGGILGVGLASPGSQLFGLGIGAFAGFAIGELLESTLVQASLPYSGPY